MTSQIDRFKTGKLIKSVMEEKGITAKDIKEYLISRACRVSIIG